MSRSSGRAQTEPLAALVAVAMVSLALGLYAGVLDSTLPGQSDRAVAEPALSAVEDRIAPVGVVRPGRVPESPAAGPDGYETNVTVTAGDRRWTAGPSAPDSARRASEQVGVRVGPASVVPGRLRVVVW